MRRSAIASNAGPDPAANLPGSRFQASPDVVIERLGDTMVTVQLGTDRILELNDTAARLVELLLEGHTPADAARLIAEEYRAPPAEVAANVETTLAKLLEENVLVPAGA